MSLLAWSMIGLHRGERVGDLALLQAQQRLAAIACT